MSTHFTYEIDERQLRVKLKDLESPNDAEAWQRYEAFTGTQGRQFAGGGVKNIKVPLNRNVIVPVVFGALIIFFSFLLFNFINIRNPKEAVKAPETSLPEVKPDPAPAQPSSIPVQTGTTEAIKQPETAISAAPVPTAAVQPAGAAANKPAAASPTTAAQPVLNKPVSRPPVSQPAQAVASPAVNQPTVAVTGADKAATGQVQGKKRQRRNDIVESDSSTDNARPSLDNEGREGEAVRPN